MIAVVSHLDVLEVLWPKLGLEATKFEKGYLRVLVIRRVSEEHDP